MQPKSKTLTMSDKVAVVTGSNQGLGLGIVRGLCKSFDGVVYLTSLYENQGTDAVTALEKEGLHPRYHHLDISNRESIIKFRDHIKENHGRINILINNAGIAFKVHAPEPPAVQAEKTVYINYFSTLLLCEILLPLLGYGARIVNIASDQAHLSNIPSLKIRNQLQDPNLSISELSNLMNRFIDETKRDTHAAKWGNSSYAVSKVAVVALTKILQRQLQNKNVKVNAVHPGYIRTDMSSHKGSMTPDEGADTPLFLALDAPDTLRGAYVWWNKNIVDWDGEFPGNPTK